MHLKILIVDDDATDRALMKRHLFKRDLKIEYLEATSGQDALSYIDKHNDITCIFLDYMLPDQDGVQVLKSMYDIESDLGPCPVVMLTGQGSESVAVEAIRFGAQDYIIKEHLSADVAHIALAKARELYDLKRTYYESKKIIEHSQRMDTVGQLTSGIAHDFNNLLTITFGNIRLLNDELHSDTLDTHYCLEKLKIVEKTTRRGADLVKKLMVFSRQRTLEPVTTHLNDLIEQLEEFLKRSLGDHIDVEMDLAGDLKYVEVDAGQMEHAILNLSINARDAMLDGGLLALKTRNIHVTDQDAHLLQLGLKAGVSYSAMSISDTGTGMSQEVKDKIFEPFFTTKDVGSGTGLGLSMVYGFVKDSSGAIDVESTPRKGTCFTLYFPHSEKNIVTKAKTITETTVATHGDETILLVEDEDEIRLITSLVLKGAGYNILEAANGDEALKIMQTHPQAADVKLLFTDIAMPGEMNGVQVAARVQVIKPNVKLLFTSGYGLGALPDMHLMMRYPVINKPYKPEDLLIKVRSVLDTPET